MTSIVVQALNIAKTCMIRCKNMLTSRDLRKYAPPPALAQPLTFAVIPNKHVA